MKAIRVFGPIALAALAATSAYAQVLQAHAGPANNGGSPNWAMFFNLTATNTLNVTHLKTANTGGVGAAFSVDIFVRTGSGLGGPVGSGPGSSSAGWTLLGNAAATQGGTASGVSNLIDIPDILVGSGQTVGVAMRFNTVGPRYFGTGTPAYSNFSDSNLLLVTGDVRSAPFTTTGSFFTSRALVGEVHYTVVPEPGSMIALGLGTAALLARRRRAKKA